MRKVCIAGNWKMNMGPQEGAKFVKELAEAVKDASARVVVAPPFVTLSGVVAATKGTNIEVAAQNMSDHLKGAFTGEVSAEMLKEVGVKLVILGHSERRTLYQESDEFINAKVKLALEEGLEVILCVGETLDEREKGQLEAVLKHQVVEGLRGVTPQQMDSIIVAYEPVWAIGTGKTATPDDANQAHALIRGEVATLFGKSVAESLIIQYGGSVKPSNVKELMAMEHIDGALVGGASLTVEQFAPIVCYNN
ncbi:MAG: triose-phosphate isomerase [Sphaerochaetaceae bacterium]|jgi:triosephosphate isomerase|nr:triose-phosphate isomerase [Sphaerochaetaceae bacterium]HHU88257.1 triose-phosphate isomerase [Spirochaetales bacterium]